MDPEKLHLKQISQRVHAALRMLKMGEVGVITCDKTFSMDEVEDYVIAYSFHKRKWFKPRRDEATGTLYCTRLAPPPFPISPEPQEYEEP